MASPYVSTRTGSGQWIMQRVSAAALVALAGTHFALQHFTTNAVSTGLTVAQRFNDPWWQAYYIVFIVLALYHGVNGLVGILRDYALPPRGRLLAEIALWCVAAYLAAMGLVGIAHPRPMAEVKEIYAANGFVAGASRGSPAVAPAIRYDFASEPHELNLLQHYLRTHTHRTDDGADPFAGGEPGAAFDAWLAREIAAGPVPVDQRDRHHVFSSTYEFAVWAADIRRADARRRRDAMMTIDPGRDAQQSILDRLAKLPSYRANDLH